MNNQRVSHRFTLVMPAELWHRITDHIYPRGRFRNATELGLVALEKYVAELDRVLPGFRTAWAASHSGNWPQSHEQYACYGVPFGPVTDEGTSVHGPRFLLSELESHCRGDLWNERTGELIRDHIEMWRQRGVVVPLPPMLPPSWNRVPQGDTPEAWAAAASAAVRAPTDAPDPDGDIE